MLTVVTPIQLRHIPDMSTLQAINHSERSSRPRSLHMQQFSEGFGVFELSILVNIQRACAPAIQYVV